MNKLACRCGETLRYGTVPCPLEWLMISDHQRFEENSVADLRADTITADLSVSELADTMTRLLRCPVCGRLWVFWSGYDQPPVEYVVAVPRPR